MSTRININEERTPLLGGFQNATPASTSAHAAANAADAQAQAVRDREIAHNMAPLNPTLSQTQIPNSSGALLAAPVKKVMAPLRVEPKVYFANERTLLSILLTFSFSPSIPRIVDSLLRFLASLSWLHFCIVLGGLAIGLLNFGDRVGQISGVAFTLVALVFMVYAVVVFRRRADMIRRRDPGPYDDTTAPVVLCVILCNFHP
ncbi:hypothetical protein HDU83_006832 [Entophlyctis luteolus]|nr:hypothetical protein HDU82_007187 [Entophlyctis luteolus]KAJ3340958.1 hypothetical protein HDU83_006832 [Entophlyctis luteolus]